VVWGRAQPAPPARGARKPARILIHFVRNLWGQISPAGKQESKNMSAKVIGVRRWVAVTILATALVAGGVFGIFAMNGSDHTELGAAKVALKMAGNPNPVSLGSFSNGFAAIMKPALPAVVGISSSKMVKTPTSVSPFQNDPFFRQFFGDQFGDQNRRPRTQ